MTPPDRYPHLEIDSVGRLDAWLAEHHGQPDAVWLVTFKKAAGARYVPHSEVLDLLVAYGWTDGIRRRLDDERTMQLISPRRTDTWAKSYRDRAERLLREGRMRESGQAAIERAKRAGTWDAMPGVDALHVPEDLRAALDGGGETARATFDAFPPSTRRNILRWIASAKRDATRADRISRTVAEARHGRPVKSHG